MGNVKSATGRTMDASLRRPRLLLVLLVVHGGGGCARRVCDVGVVDCAIQMIVVMRNQMRAKGGD